MKIRIIIKREHDYVLDSSFPWALTRTLINVYLGASSWSTISLQRQWARHTIRISKHTVDFIYTPFNLVELEQINIVIIQYFLAIALFYTTLNFHWTNWVYLKVVFAASSNISKLYSSHPLSIFRLFLLFRLCNIAVPKAYAKYMIIANTKYFESNRF